MCRTKIERSSGCNHMLCALCSYEFCWVCGAPAKFNHFLPISFFGCGVALYQNDFTSAPMLLCFKLVKYLIVLLALVILAFVIPPAFLTVQLYEEDRIYYKKHKREGLLPGSKTRNLVIIFIRDVSRQLTILKGLMVGILSDILFTPIIMLIETVGVFAGIPFMIWQEREERDKIHR